MSRPDETPAADPALDERIQEWLDSLSSFLVRGLAVLGPASPDDVMRRAVWRVYPPVLECAAERFAESEAYGPAWRASQSPAMAWQNLADGGPDSWSRFLREQGVLAIVRSDFSMPFGAGFECIALLGRPLADRSEAFEVGWALNNCWPGIKDAVIASRFGLTPRTRQVLRVLAEGRTAREAAEIVNCRERTVHFHLSTVMTRLNADNRAAAILRACMLGLL